jgi:hypothetical protein|tara:strand:- start:661 stop:1644 length:984 start_codon:yes stop_codon:yes gene_type:complete
MKKFLLLLSVLFVVSCSSDTEELAPVIIANTSLIYPEELLEIPSQEIIDLMNFAYNKMENSTSKILAVSWKVGAFISEGGFDRPFNTHAVTLSQETIESIIEQTGTWIDAAFVAEGLPSDYPIEEIKNEQLISLRNYLEGGADASTQLNLSPNIRILYLAKPTNMNHSSDYLTFVLHETYHALQKDIAIESCLISRETNSKSNFSWIIEGAAEYFAQKIYQELNSSYNGSNRFMADAFYSYQEDNREALINSGSIASRGAAALSLMIQKGFLQESLILDGSLFHNCTTETDYLDANSHILNVKENWFKISSDNGNYSFTTEALEGSI